VSEFKAAAAQLGKKSHPQIWLPNASHLEMFHSLALRYLWTKFEIEDETKESNFERINALRSLGRISNYLFMVAQLPGQTQVVLGSTALKDAFCFPADDIRQSHLGFL